jgi:hypothetical protein
VDSSVRKKRAKIFKSTNIVSNTMSKELIDETNNFMEYKTICYIESLNETTYVIYWEE